MSDLAGPDPTIHRRRLRSELRKAREACGKTQRETAAAMDWSMSKLIRIETGDVKISTNDLRALLAFYTVADDRVVHLVEVARAAREPARWIAYRGVVSPEYLTFLGYESSATIIRNFETILVPGLLQTEEYAQEVAKEINGPERADSVVDLRIERQEILSRPAAPELHFMIDESVVHHVIGGPEIMRRQLLQLKELANLPNVHLRIVSYSAGLYPRMRNPYVIFEFGSPEDEAVLYIEEATGEFIVRESTSNDGDKNGPTDYLRAFWQLEQVAPRENSPSIIDAALEKLTIH